MIYFNLRNQEEDVKDSVVSLTFRYELNGGNPTNYTINALVLHEKEIELVYSKWQTSYKSLKMNQEYKVNLSQGQKAKLAKAIKDGSALKLRLGKML